MYAVYGKIAVIDVHKKVLYVVCPTEEDEAHTV